MGKKNLSTGCLFFSRGKARRETLRDALPTPHRAPVSLCQSPLLPSGFALNEREGRTLSIGIVHINTASVHSNSTTYAPHSRTRERESLRSLFPPPQESCLPTDLPYRFVLYSRPESGIDSPPAPIQHAPNAIALLAFCCKICSSKLGRLAAAVLLLCCNHQCESYLSKPKVKRARKVEKICTGPAAAAAQHGFFVRSPHHHHHHRTYLPPSSGFNGYVCNPYFRVCNNAELLFSSVVGKIVSSFQKMYIHQPSFCGLT